MKTIILQTLQKYIVVLGSLILLTACGASAPESATPEQNETVTVQEESTLYQHEWHLISLQGAKAGKGADGRMVSINFDDNTNKVTGYAGCNNYFSLFTVDGESLSIGAMGMTRRYCEKQADLETKFSKVLANAKFYQIEQGKLLLKDSDKNITAVLIKGQ